MTGDSGQTKKAPRPSTGFGAYQFLLLLELEPVHVGTTAEHNIQRVNA